MNTSITLNILRNQIKEINNTIFEYVQNVVCPKISIFNEVTWTYLNLSKNSLWITAKNPDMSRLPGGTIAIDFKNGTWFFRNTFGNVFTGVGPKSANAEQVLNYHHAMSILMLYDKDNEMMSHLNELFMKKQALHEAIHVLLK